MGALTELEIFDCLIENFRVAADCCDRLANVPQAGPTYDHLRTSLLLIEGACRQASVWREDTRWLPVGMMMHEAHIRAGDWLRGHMPRKLFGMLADNLRAGQKMAEDLRDKRTNMRGIILPEMHREIRTQGRPMQVRSPYSQFSGAA